MQERTCSLKLDSLAHRKNGHVTYETVSMQQDDANNAFLVLVCNSFELFAACVQVDQRSCVL